MQKIRFLLILTISPIFIALKTNVWAAYPASLDKYNYLLKIDEEIQKRWEKVIEIKKNFAPCSIKSNQEITSEFQNLNKLRKHLWYTNTNQSSLINNKDYQIASQLLNLKSFPRYPYLIAFNYNHINDFYNASNLFLYGYHFIALEEPMQETLDAFFTLLINQEASILIRLKPEGEYADYGSLTYWKDRIRQDTHHSFIQLNSPHSQILEANIEIPYFYTNEWIDNKAINVVTLYNLVREVKNVYKKINDPGPIACHCAAGVGRTGTFITAFIIANLLDLFEPNEISIEEIVLKLSIQRFRMVTTVEQYLILYRFAEYYLVMKNILDHNLEEIDL